jgi:phosphatidate cytidylyltransferase
MLAIGACVLVALAAGDDSVWTRVVLAACGAATLFWVFVAPPWLAMHWKPASKLAMAAAGGVALTGAWVALVALQARSPWLVLAAMAVVWIADTAAYFAGRAFGTHKLAPRVSPGKTWEGVYGALAAVAVYALVLVPLADAAGRSAPVTRWQLPCGSLARWRSLRSPSKATSSSRCSSATPTSRTAAASFPGHGGVLDRIDALLAAMPAAALLAHAYLR